MLSRIIAYVDQNNIKLTPNNLRYVYTGTAPLDLSLRQSVERVFGVVLHNGYGLTETSPTISRTLYAMGSNEINIGPPIPESKPRSSDLMGGKYPMAKRANCSFAGPT